MKQFSRQQIFCIGWFVFFVINILQAAFLGAGELFWPLQLQQQD